MSQNLNKWKKKEYVIVEIGIVCPAVANIKSSVLIFLKVMSYVNFNQAN